MAENENTPPPENTTATATPNTQSCDRPPPKKPEPDPEIVEASDDEVKAETGIVGEREPKEENKGPDEMDVDGQDAKEEQAEEDASAEGEKPCSNCRIAFLDKYIRQKTLSG